MKRNCFETPQTYISEVITNVRIPTDKRRKFLGKSLASVFLTKFCKSGCAHCFFKSRPMQDEKICQPKEQYEFSKYGLERFLEFINASNNGYLLVVGGGEPFEKEEFVMEIIRRVHTTSLILVTNGMWGQDYNNAKKMIFSLYESFQKRECKNLRLTLRLSVDKWHINKLGYQLVNNIIDVYKEFFRDKEGFELQIHTLVGDDSIDQLVAERKDFTLIRKDEVHNSDKGEIFKISPHRWKMIFNDGYEVEIGTARLFYSTLTPDISKMSDSVQKAIQIYDEDMEFSNSGNQSIIYNKNGTVGLNFWINYNGNVSLWGNQQLTDIKNVYVDEPNDIINNCFENIIAYSYLDKGNTYRQSIVGEVNNKAVIRSKAINLRDYSGASILEEKKTVLYYAVRVIQDYMKEGILKREDLDNMSNELIELISQSTETLKRLYHESNYSIITQYMERTVFQKDDWKDLFTLIRLGHYDVSDEQVKEALLYYNLYGNEEIKSIKEIKCNMDNQYDRLNNRLSFMKKEAADLCTDQHI